MPINRGKFFDGIRQSIFSGSLTLSTVQGCSAILDEWERRGLTDLRWLADMLATARGECGPNMLPVREGFSSSDERARAFVTKQGYKYAVVVHGHVWYGRGLVQLTWYDNYLKFRDEVKRIFGVDIIENPDAVLRPAIAAYIMFEGMIRGTFTGKKLADYFNATTTDWVNARRIINGTDKAQTFAAWAEKFHAALTAAGAALAPVPPPDVPKPVNQPVSVPAPKSEDRKPVALPTGGAVVTTGAGGVIANEAHKSGVTASQIAVVLLATAIIAGAVFIVIRNWRS